MGSRFKRAVDISQLCIDFLFASVRVAVTSPPVTASIVRADRRTTSDYSTPSAAAPYEMQRRQDTISLEALAVRYDSDSSDEIPSPEPQVHKRAVSSGTSECEEEEALDAFDLTRHGVLFSDKMIGPKHAQPLKNALHVRTDLVWVRRCTPLPFRNWIPIFGRALSAILLPKRSGMSVRMLEWMGHFENRKDDV